MATSVAIARKSYSQKFRKAAVERVLALRHLAKFVFERLGICDDTLRKWVDVARFNAGTSLISADLPVEQRVGELEKENVRLRMERAIAINSKHFDDNHPNVKSVRESMQIAGCDA